VIERVSAVWGSIARRRAPVSGPVSRLMSGLPIFFITLWWLVCFGFYITGWPIQYNRGNVGTVALLFVAALVLVVASFLFIVWRRPLALKVRADSPELRRLPWFVVAGTVAVIALYFPLAATYSGYNFWEILPALSDQNEAYYLGSARIAEGYGPRALIVLAQTALAPLTLIVLPYLAMRWFDRKRPLMLALLVVVLATSVFQSILTGRDFQLVLAAVLIACAWLASRVRRGVYFAWIDLWVVLGAGAIGGLTFGLRKFARVNGVAFCPQGADICAIPHTPTIWESITVTVASYASQGFEGMGRALNAEWVFGGGYSHSPALAGILKTLFGIENNNVVTSQLDSLGWSSTGYWSTGFTLIANDIPWALVPVVVALQSVLLAFAWRAVVSRGDWLSLGVFAYSFLSLLFMPMNLQLAISGPIYIGYIVITSAFIVRAVVRAIGARRDPGEPDESADVRTPRLIAGRSLV
jgi:hypothetical protein